MSSAPGWIRARRWCCRYAVGTQDYICLPSGWTPFGPQAIPFNDDSKQIITHFLSPNPDRDDMRFATWQHSQDTSADPAFVAPDAIPWFLLEVVGAQAGPTGGQKLTKTNSSAAEHDWREAAVAPVRPRRSRQKRAGGVHG